jgi:hypothetical protein
MHTGKTRVKIANYALKNIVLNMDCFSKATTNHIFKTKPEWYEKKKLLIAIDVVVCQQRPACTAEFPKDIVR